MRDGATLDQKVAGSLVVDDASVARWAAMDGLGVALLARSFVGESIARGELVSLLEPWCPARAGFFLYRPVAAEPSAAVRAFSAFL